MVDLLTADLHFSDKEADTYRWTVFESIAAAVANYDVGRVFILGDMVDRKDRHSAELVNRLVDELFTLVDNFPSLEVWIIMGNHDMPLSGTPFWRFLDDYHPRIRYLVEPELTDDGVLLLPYVSNPSVEWAAWSTSRWGNVRCIMMHQPANGCVSESGRTLSIEDHLPLFPRTVPIYSGDIHTPQVVQRINYVGAPYHIHFGDKYFCRMLLLDDKFGIKEELTLSPPRKELLEITDVADLCITDLAEGDQAKVRFTLDISQIEDWPRLQADVQRWAAEKGIALSSIEAIVQNGPVTATGSGTTDNDPPAVLFDYATDAQLDEVVFKAGMAFLEKAMSGV